MLRQAGRNEEDIAKSETERLHCHLDVNSRSSRHCRGGYGGHSFPRSEQQWPMCYLLHMIRLQNHLLTVNITVFWDVTPRRWVGRCPRFGGISCLKGGDGGSRFLRNVPNCTTSHPRKPQPQHRRWNLKSDSIIFPEQSVSVQRVKKSPSMNAAGSLPYSQQTATGPYLEPAAPSHSITFNFRLSIHFRLSLLDDFFTGGFRPTRM
jgi:hypothetical protein